MRTLTLLTLALLATSCAQALEDAPDQESLFLTTAPQEPARATVALSDWALKTYNTLDESTITLRATAPARLGEEIVSTQRIELGLEEKVHFVYGVFQIDEIEGVGACFAELHVENWRHQFDSNQQNARISTCNRARVFSMNGEVEGAPEIKTRGGSQEIRLRPSNISEEQREACQAAIDAMPTPIKITHTSTVHIK